MTTSPNASWARLGLLASLCALAACSGDDAGGPVQGTVNTGGGGGDAGTLADGAAAKGDTSEADDASGGGRGDSAGADDADVAVSDGGSADAGGKDAGGGDDAGAGEDTGGANDVAGGKDAASGKDAGGTAKGCAAAASCVASCGKAPKADCVSACILATPDEAKGELSGLMSCIEVACIQGECSDGAPGCVDQCLNKNCFGEMLACLDDGVSGTATCSTALTCFGVCKDVGNPWNCLSTCYNGLTEPAKAQVSAYGACAAEAAKAGEKPDKLCLVELAVCYADGKKGEAACHTIFDCVEACTAAGGKDDICGLTCLGSMSPEAQQQYKAVGGCWENAQGPSGACVDAFESCIAPAGTLDCKGVLKCTASCSGDQESKMPGCMFKCGHQATKSAAVDYLGLVACEKQGTCAQALTTCAKPAGAANCQATFQCLGACEGKKEGEGIACFVDCLAAATPKGADALVKVMVCEEACKKECKGDGACKSACTKANCSADLANCIVN